jgi:6-pyruvoyltetrahydropterin/6-carboxytetrahydropterin synthase
MARVGPARRLALGRSAVMLEGMFSVGVSDHCMVAHSFADPFFGPAQRLHGATYTVRVEVRSAELGSHHVVMDIGALRSIVGRAVKAIDYSNLDDNPAFPDRTSTTERVARYLADAIAGAIRELPDDGRPVEPATLQVCLGESPTAWAAYERAIT